MRPFIAALLCFVSFCAYSAYDVTAVMPSTTGVPDQCRLYLNGSVVGSGECDRAVTFPGLLPGDGTYAFAYSLVNAAGETALSPETFVTITTIPLPGEPTQPPAISIECTDNAGIPIPCPSNVIITISP